MPGDSQSVEWFPARIHAKLLHAACLAHTAIIYTRSWCANSAIARVRLAGRLEQARAEIALLREELRIKDVRMVRIEPHRRPFYPATERLAILELKASRGWNTATTARMFQVEPDTIADWMHRIHDVSLLRTPEPINRYPAFVRHIIQRLKVLCPAMGNRRIAEVLARAGLQLSATTARRLIRNRPHSPSGFPVSDFNRHPSVVTSRHPNHVWHVDLTVVPTSGGFWSAWFPFTLPQGWPFCWWVAVVLDHFSRKVMGFALFKRQPTGEQVCRFLGQAMHSQRARPLHVICDRGKQFDCAGFRRWARRKNIRVRYGAVGKYGSIAIIERFMRSMKSEWTRLVLLPLNLRSMRFELGLYITWYNEYRPHQSLSGMTPMEVYSGVDPPSITARAANSALPIMELVVERFHGRVPLPIVSLRLAA